MDRATIINRLAQAEKHVATGERNIARQRQIVSDLERDAHNTAQARAILAVFEETQKLHIGHRDELRRELASLAQSK